GEKGYARAHGASAPDPVVLKRARAEAAVRELVAKREQLNKARWLWSRRHPLGGSLAERYLRQARRYNGPMPATLGYLPPCDNHNPAMIAAFGLATEPEPGVLAIADRAVRGIHITRLAADGMGKARTDTEKITVGSSSGSPIVLAPANDLLGLIV